MDFSLSQQIRMYAQEIGFDGCGIIPVGEVKPFEKYLQKRISAVPESARFYANQSRYANVEKDYPWAKSIVVCIQNIGQYRLPERIQRYYAPMLLRSTYEAANIPEKKAAMEAWFVNQGIRCENEAQKGSVSFTSARFAAEIAGLGIVRRNNAFYTEHGSYVAIEMWLIDRECRYIQECTLEPCPKDCDRCIKVCPTHSLTEPYTMNPARCVSFFTTIGSGALPMDVSEAMLGRILWGCDECQKACPYNHTQSSGELVNITNPDAFLPEFISTATDEQLLKELYPDLALRMRTNNLELIRTDAKRVLRFEYENVKK